MADNFGVIPERKRIIAVEGSDWSVTLENLTGADWDAGDVFTIEFADGTTWTASKSGRFAKFSQDEAVMDALPDGQPWKLYADDGVTKVCWFLGTVVRVD